MLDGLRHGYGKLTTADSPVTYEGQWHHGKRQGKGVLYYNEDRTTYYEGVVQGLSLNKLQRRGLL